MLIVSQLKKLRDESLFIYFRLRPMYTFFSTALMTQEAIGAPDAMPIYSSTNQSILYLFL